MKDLPVTIVFVDSTINQFLNLYENFYNFLADLWMVLWRNFWKFLELSAGYLRSWLWLLIKLKLRDEIPFACPITTCASAILSRLRQTLTARVRWSRQLSCDSRTIPFYWNRQIQQQSRLPCKHASSYGRHPRSWSKSSRERPQALVRRDPRSWWKSGPF